MWTIDKSVTPDQIEIFKGDSGAVQYTVEVIKNAGHGERLGCGGVITIQNPNVTQFTANVTDAVNNGGTCTVDGSGTKAVTVPASTSVNVNYTCTYASKPAYNQTATNTATVRVALNTPSATYAFAGSQTFSFTDPTTLHPQLNHRLGQQQPGWLAMDHQRQRFVELRQDLRMQCRRWDEEQSGFDHLRRQHRRAVPRRRGLVTCRDLRVAKTANTSFTRTYHWTIAKSSPVSNLTLSVGQQYLASFSVRLETRRTPTAIGLWPVRSMWSTWRLPRAATINSVSDMISGVGAATVDCGVITFPYDLAAGDTLNCTYSASLPGARTAALTRPPPFYRTTPTTTRRMRRTLAPHRSPTLSVSGSEARPSPMWTNA